jgi:two-component system, NarL family, invasion response regulator UvrY
VIRVLVCDDHAIVRQGIRQLLADSPDLIVVAEAETAGEAYTCVAEASLAEPVDVVLMDIAMPHRDGLDVLRRLRGDFPALPVLMLSSYPDKQYAVRSLKLGAAGYLNKSADSRQMADAIRHVVAGGLFITPTVAVQLADALGMGGESGSGERLTQREYQVFHLLAGGRSVGEIAEQLQLPPATVRSWRARVLEKTGARNDIELALCTVTPERMPP